MRIAMMGSGGLGAFLGGLLAQAGEEVTFIARGANLEALRTGGLTVKRPACDDLHLDVRATDDPGELGPVDLIWFCVKSYDLDAAAHQAAPLVGPATAALTIQNGVEAPERIAAALSGAAVLGGAVLGGATLIAPGIVEQKTARLPVKLGEPLGGVSPRAERLQRVLLAAGIDAEASPDIRRELWEKFIYTCVAGLCTLARLPVGAIVDRPETAELARGIMAEAEAVGRARGIALEDGTLDRLFQRLQTVAATSPAMHPSMYFDLVQGRRLELDALNGAVVRMGRESGVPTPLNFAVYAALGAYAEGPPTLPA
jgi:2-dehydropantoate 2-reductase